MIYVVELPEEGKPRAWFAYDDEDFSRKVAASDPLQPWEIHDEDYGLIIRGGKTIADVQTGNNADSDLIAAAPDLYDALLGLSSAALILDFKSEASMATLGRMIPIASAALAKARGES